jgi:hypothetical protein
MSPAAYPYFLVSLGLASLAALCYALWPRSDKTGWRALLAAGLLAAPFGLLSFEYIPKYWNPTLLLWFGPASGEDILFIAASGMLGWAVAAWPFRQRLRHAWFENNSKDRWSALLTRFAIGAVPGLAVSYAFKYGLPSQPVMNGTMWGIAVGGALLLCWKPRLWLLAVVGCTAFLLGYFALMKLLFLVAPEWSAPWHSALQPHSWVAGVPLYELLWAAGFGAVWPLFVGYCLDTRLVSRTDPP